MSNENLTPGNNDGDQVSSFDAQDVQSVEVVMEPGGIYEVPNVQASEIKSFVQEGADLTVSFTDDSSVTFKNFSDAVTSSNPARISVQNSNLGSALNGLIGSLGFDAQVVSVEADSDSSSGDDARSPQANVRADSDDGEQEVAQNDSAVDEVADRLSEIEPAAGDDAGSDNSGRGGYGFQSSFDAQGVVELDDVGPIDPTELAYGLNDQSDDLLVAAAPAAPPINDAPELSIESQDDNVDETTDIGVVGSANGTVVFDFGDDGAGPDGLCFNDDFSFGGSTGVDLESAGQTVTVVGTPDGYTGTALINGVVETIFTLTLDRTTGDYVYTQVLPFDHADGTTSNDTIILNFGVKVQDSDLDETTDTIIINVADDGPFVPSQDEQTVDETTDIGAVGSASGTVVVQFGADGDGGISANDSFTAGGSLAGGALTSGGVAVDVQLVGGNYVGYLQGTTTEVFTLTLDADGNYEFTQNLPLDHADITDPDDVIRLDFGFDAQDGDGDSDDGVITINVRDDGPEAAADAVAADEFSIAEGNVIDGTISTGTGTGGADDFGADGPGFVNQVTFGGTTLDIADGQTVVIRGTYGELTISSDGEYTYRGDQGATGMDEFTYRIEDGDGDTATTDASTTITFTTQDDLPVVTNSVYEVDETDHLGVVDRDGGSVNPDFGADGGTVTASGANTFVAGGSLAGGALTSEGNAVTVELVGNQYIGRTGPDPDDIVFTLDVLADGTYFFDLLLPLDHLNTTDPDDTIILNFGVTATDGDGDTATATITVNVDDDGPIARDDDAGTIQDSGSVTGNVVDGIVNGVTDFNQADDFGADGEGYLNAVTFNGVTTPIADGQTVTITGTYGTLEISSDGEYTYTAFADVDGTDVFTYQLIDGDGDTATADATATLTITVSDDDQPIVTNIEHDLDETDGFSQSVTGDIVVDFGADGEAADAIRPTGEASFGAQDYQGNDITDTLTSDGQAIDVTLQGDSYVGELADGTVIFRLDINADDTYNFTLFGPLDHANDLDHDDNIQLVFGFTAEDGDGDETEGTITINVADDGPFIDNQSDSYDEVVDPNVSTLVSVTDTITDFDFGEDGSGDIHITGNFDAAFQVGGSGDVVTSGGEPITVTSLGNTYTGTLPNGQVAFEFEITNPLTGEYTYNQYVPIDHQGAGQDVIWLKFEVEIVDADGDTDVAIIGIDIRDGVPEINDNPDVGQGREVVDETDDIGDVVTGTLAVDFGADGAADVDAIATNDTYTVTADGNPIDLYSDGHLVTIQETAGGYEGLSADGRTVFTITIDENTGEYSFTLLDAIDHPDGTNPDDIIRLQFGVDVTDGDGDTDSGFITIDVHDDGPEAVDDTVVTDENTGIASGNVVDGDVDVGIGIGGRDDFGEDGAGHLNSVTFNGVTTTIAHGQTVTISGDFGDLMISWDGEYTYTGNPGAEGTDRFTYTIIDGDGDTATADATATLIVNVTDDDQPIVTSVEATVDETDLHDDGTEFVQGTVQVNYGDDGPGQLSFNGITGVSHTLTSGGDSVTISAPQVVAGTGEWIYSAETAAGDVIFTLTLDPQTGEYRFDLLGNLDHPDASDDDDVIEIVFGVIATDSDGDTTDSTITINVRDDGPSISLPRAQTPNVDESNLENGSITANGLLNENYGADGPGEISGTGVWSAVGHAGQPITLTSGGDTVDVSFANGTYTGVNSVTGETVFELSIDPLTGEYTYTQHTALDHTDPNSGVDQIGLIFGVQITDGDGDTANIDIRIDINDSGVEINDNPVQGEGFERVNEAVDINRLVSGNVDIIDGQDGPVTISVPVDGVFQAFGDDGSTAIVNLESNGQPVDVSVTYASGGAGPQSWIYLGTAGGETIFTLQVNVDGSYDFVLSGPLDHLEQGLDDVFLRFGITATDGDGDRDDGFITIQVADDHVAIIEAEEGEVSEDDIDADGVTITGDLTIDYGVDGAAGLGSTGETNASEFTSGGQIVQIYHARENVDGFDGYIGTFDLGNPNADPVFELRINEDGTYTFTLFKSLDHEGVYDDEIELEFGFWARDGDGDLDDQFIRITIEDSVPTAQSETYYAIDEGELASGTVTVGGDLTVDYGADGAGGISLNGDFSSFVMGGDLSSGGVAIDVQLVGGDYVGYLTGTNTEAFRLSIDPVTGEYEFELFRSLDHHTNGLLGDNIGLHFGVDVADGDGDTTTTQISIWVRDDEPTISADPNMGVDESGLDYSIPGNSISVTEDLKIDFGGDAAGATVEANDVFSVSGGHPLTSNGQAIVVTSDGANGYVGMLGNQMIFALTFNPVKSNYTYTQWGAIDHPNSSDPNDILTLNFGVQVVDGDGDIDSTTIRVDIADDGPVAVDDFREFNAGTSITGNILANDDVGADAGMPNASVSTDARGLGTVTEIEFNGVTYNVPQTGYLTVIGDYGRLFINKDGAYRYSRDNGDGTDTFNYTMQDADGDESSARLEIEVEIPTTVDLDVTTQTGDFIVKEDGSIEVNIQADAQNLHQHDYMEVLVENVPETWGVEYGSGWSVIVNSDDTRSYRYIGARGDDDLSLDFTFSPPADSHIDLNDIPVSVTAHQNGNGAVLDDANTDFDIIVDAVADDLEFTSTPNHFTHGNRDDGAVINLADHGQHIAFQLEDLDGSEVVQEILVELEYDTIQRGITLNVGERIGTTNQWRVTTEELEDLELIYNHQGGGLPVDSHTVRVIVKTHEDDDVITAGGDVEDDDSDNENQTELEFTFNWITSPLALDLDGDGVEHVGVDDGVMFDITADGHVDQTGWISADDALLVLDHNQDGIINDGSELFGDAVTDGFAMLSDYDSNADGIINSADDVWAELQIWQDLNQDGVSQQNELFTMDDIGIASINLNATEVDIDGGNGNIISHISTFTWIDGSEGEIVDIWFSVYNGEQITEGLEIIGTDDNDVIQGSQNSDVISGLEGDDILFGAGGADVFLFEAMDGSVDTIKDFEVGHDILDISGLLEGFDPLQHDINDFVISNDNGGDTVISIDVDGAAGPSEFVEIAIIEGVTDLDIAELTNNGQSAVV